MNNMINQYNEIPFNFSYFALKLLGNGLYSNPWTAISELVANGLDAQANKIKILIDMRDKKKSVIEIFDNGIGMSYEDLKNKYTLVGRNKREDSDLDEYSKNIVMGRKGIGKLAALYLSDKYYVISKTKQEISAWYFDMKGKSESTIPSLVRIDVNNLNIIAQKEWENFTTGTMIKLNNVDLTNIGVQTIEGLKARISDFYLTDSLDGQIELAIISSDNDEINFEKIKKDIAFKNFYAIFDNSGLNIKNRIKEKVKFRSVFPEIGDKLRNTEILNADNFLQVAGKRKFYKEKGVLTDKEIPYQLKGWIGIHASINKNEAQENDTSFLRNKAYKATHLRLYVRNKLVVEDFLPYLKNTQAFANYIEGEISFDVLDNNVLPDIITADRQKLMEEDERIILLVDIVKPIVNALVAKRVAIGAKIKDEEKGLRERAEIEKNESQKKQFQAEQACKEAKEKQKQAEDNVKKYNAQNKIIFAAMSEDQKSFSAKTHLVKTNILIIRNNIRTLAKKIGVDKYREVESISVVTDKILSILKYNALATFNIEDEFIEENFFLFIKEYVEKIMARQYYDVKIIIDIKNDFVFRFSPQSVALLFDNLFSNSVKSTCKTISIHMDATRNEANIIFEDDGVGFKDNDLNKIFEFGFSNTEGTGIGLYNVCKVIQEFNGTIVAQANECKGAKFIISVPLKKD